MTEPRLGIILFARMSSSRLPGKMLRPLGPTTLFDRVVERAQLLGEDLLLATSDQTSDDALVQRARELDLPVFRGSLDDVLGRAVAAAQYAGFDAFCRLCGDRPFMPLDDMHSGMEIMRQSFDDAAPWDLVTSKLQGSLPAGLTTEVIRTDALQALAKGARTAVEREHLTTAFYENSSQYRVHSLASQYCRYEGLNFAIDNQNDMNLIGRAINHDPDPGVSVSKAYDLLKVMEKQSAC